MKENLPQSLAATMNLPPISDTDALARWARQRTGPGELTDEMWSAMPVVVREHLLRHLPPGTLSEQQIRGCLVVPTLKVPLLVGGALSDAQVSELLDAMFEQITSNQSYEDAEQTIHALYAAGRVTRGELHRRASAIIRTAQMPDYWGASALGRLPCWFDYTGPELEVLLDWAERRRPEDVFLLHPRLSGERALDFICERIRGGSYDRSCRLWFEWNEPDDAVLSRVIEAAASRPRPTAALDLIESLPEAWLARVEPAVLSHFLESSEREVRIRAQALVGSGRRETPERALGDGLRAADARQRGRRVR